MKFSKNLKAARIQAGLTQREVVMQYGGSIRYLSQLENGRSGISLSLMARLSNALQVPIATLLSETQYEGYQHSS